MCVRVHVQSNIPLRNILSTKLHTKITWRFSGFLQNVSSNDVRSFRRRGKKDFLSFFFSFFFFIYLSLNIRRRRRHCRRGSTKLCEDLGLKISNANSLKIEISRIETPTSILFLVFLRSFLLAFFFPFFFSSLFYCPRWTSIIADKEIGKDLMEIGMSRSRGFDSTISRSLNRLTTRF